MKGIVLACILAAIAAIAPARAQSPQQIPQIELSENMVHAFIASIPDIKALAERYEGMPPARGDGNPVSTFQGMAVSAAAKADMDRTVGAHGFGDYQTWIIVAQNIFGTYTYVKMGAGRQQMGGMDAQMSAAMAAIRNNPQLTPQQKQMIAAQMGGQMEAMNQAMAAAPTPSDHNVALITGMSAEIEAGLQAMNRR